MTTFDGDKGSRHEYERIDRECPQGCMNPGGLRRVTHHTGKIRVFEVYGEMVEEEMTETYVKCPTCGWVMDR